MLTGELYKLVFTDGKCYIGASIQGAKARYNDHMHSANRGSSSPVHIAWRILGAPVLIVLKQKVYEKTLWPLEKATIEQHNSIYPNGYNGLPGRHMPPGRLGKRTSEQAKEKNKLAHLGNVVSADTKIRMSIAGRNRRHSETTKAKMSNSQNIRYKDPKEKAKQTQNNLNRFKNPAEREKSRQAALKRWANYRNNLKEIKRV